MHDKKIPIKKKKYERLCKFGVVWVYVLQNTNAHAWSTYITLSL